MRTILNKPLLPSPFALAILLSVFAYALAYFQTAPASSDNSTPYAIQLLLFWEKGFWELLDFSMQMMLILILGHVLALSAPVHRLIVRLTRFCTNGSVAVAYIALFTCVVALFNWGLGLIFGAIFARLVGEKASKEGWKLNYPLAAAAAYSGMMIWHGGLSGSAPLKVAEAGHFLEQLTGIIPLRDTVFSAMNISSSLLFVLLIPLFFRALGKFLPAKPYTLEPFQFKTQSATFEGAEKIDNSRLLGTSIGLLFLFVASWKLYQAPQSWMYQFTPNFLNWLLLGLCFLLHGSLYKLNQATESAMRDGAGILIQFPLYAGIMGIVKYSGLVEQLSDSFVMMASTDTLPFLTFWSASIINIFVPSGGGQWIVQGPIVVEAAIQMGTSVPKAVMALAYGDQLTNMIQPFWALPLLAITGVKGKDILPYSAALMVLGFCIISLVLWMF